ncbi:hypothetical protein Dda_7141 [Drechslerella dactyloides]|uniref:Nucleoside phosphorylase domain-containing protein n=1 Tax=Drechslerella dactyloides TaxID=74499 RepID=A0AAD6IXJ0_DREDA|nr:hypothetical protein Dda_7141 [Drechslerella dactyloides]
MDRRLDSKDYTIGWICALPVELAVAVAILDERHPLLPQDEQDKNAYEFGRVGSCNIIIACLPSGVYGVTSAASVAAQMRRSFPSIKAGLMVGIAGGAPVLPQRDIRLGDVVVSEPVPGFPGVVQYDFGKTVQEGRLVQTGVLNKPPKQFLTVVAKLKSESLLRQNNGINDIIAETLRRGAAPQEFSRPPNDSDRLFQADYDHPSESASCDGCEIGKVVERAPRPHDQPDIHYGLIASGNQVMKHGMTRDRLVREHGMLCFEMEAAGLMDELPSLVVRGICDYSDSHKNKSWQPYAALVAAIYAKQVLLQIPAASEREDEDTSGEQGRMERINFVVPFRMPYIRNRNFVGRAEELRRIYKYFKKPISTDIPSIYALTGTGGMGKTQIALEYAYRHHHDYTAVFWVNAANEDTIRTSFMGIMQLIVKEQARMMWPKSTPNFEIAASRLGIPGYINGKGLISAEPETIYDLETFHIQEYLPNHGGGAILITSRRPHFFPRVEQGGLDGLDRASATNLLLLNSAQSSDPREDGENEASELVEKLGFMPLAIMHAGCFISEAKMPLKEYLSSYDDMFMSIQSRKPRIGWDYRDDTTITTLELSFSEIEKQDVQAARLLLTCSYLNPAEISEDLWLDTPSDNDFRHKNNAKYYSQEQKRYTPHLEYMSQLIKPNISEMLLHQAQGLDLGNIGIIREIGKTLFMRGKLREALQFHKQLFSVCEKILGKSHEDTVLALWLVKINALDRGEDDGPDDILQRLEWILHSREKSLGKEHIVLLIGSALYYQGKYDEAMQYSQRAFTGLEKTLGNVHPLTLHAVHIVGLVLHRQGKYDDAMHWLQQALAGREEALGKDSLETLCTVDSIGGVFYSQGKYDEAIGWYERALAGREKVLGEGNPITHCTVNNIGEVFCKQGKYDEAMQWCKRALAGHEKALGRDHPSILGTVYRIGLVLYEQDKYDEAMQQYQRALTGKEKALGRDHPDMFYIIQSTGNVFVCQGKYDEAMEWYQRALAGFEKTSGQDHPETLHAVNNIGFVLCRQGKYDEAMRRYERALAGFEKALGKDHPSTLGTVDSIGSVLYGQGKYDEAMQQYQRALTGREKALGKDHPSTLGTVDSIGLVFERQGKYDEAMQWCKRALAGHEKALGRDHPSTLGTVYRIGLVLYGQDKYDEAMQWYERALAGKEKALGEDHPDTLGVVDRIGDVFLCQDKYDEAMQRYERALAGKEKALGEDHPDTLGAVNNIGLVFERQGKYDEAMQRYERALAGFEKALGEDHPATLDVINSIGVVLYGQRKYEEAMQWCKRALTGFEKALGKEHPSYLVTVKNMALLKRMPVDSKTDVRHLENIRTVIKICEAGEPPAKFYQLGKPVESIRDVMFSKPIWAEAPIALQIVEVIEICPSMQVVGAFGPSHVTLCPKGLVRSILRFWGPIDSHSPVFFNTATGSITNVKWMRIHARLWDQLRLQPALDVWFQEIAMIWLQPPADGVRLSGGGIRNFLPGRPPQVGLLLLQQLTSIWCSIKVRLAWWAEQTNTLRRRIIDDNSDDDESDSKSNTGSEWSWVCLNRANSWRVVLWCVVREKAKRATEREQWHA